jgi:hypothetical protein
MVLLSIIVFIHKIFMTSVSKGSPLQDHPRFLSVTAHLLRRCVHSKASELV